MEVFGRDNGTVERAAEDPGLEFFVYGGRAPMAVRHLRRFILVGRGEIPMHEHKGPDAEVLIPLSGLYRVVCGDGPVAEIGVGDIIVSTPGQSHEVVNITDGPGELLIFTTPSGSDLRL